MACVMWFFRSFIYFQSSNDPSKKPEIQKYQAKLRDALAKHGQKVDEIPGMEAVEDDFLSDEGNYP